MNLTNNNQDVPLNRSLINMVFIGIKMGNCQKSKKGKQKKLAMKAIKAKIIYNFHKL
jgi:hypothetical protein